MGLLTKQGWALKINGRIRAVSLVRRPEWKRDRVVANRRAEIVPVMIFEQVPPPTKRQLEKAMRDGAKSAAEVRKQLDSMIPDGDDLRFRLH